MHLKPDELVDIAEGTRSASTAPHLAACEQCRQQLADLRATMSAVAETEVPEPSPIFWAHFSERVREAVAAEGAPRTFWHDLMSWPRVLVPVSALAAAVVVMIGIGVTLNVTSRDVPSAATTTAEHVSDSQQITDDPFLGMVADLTGTLDPDTAEEVGFIADTTADYAMAHLDDKELRELRRLLQAELGKPADDRMIDRR